MYWSTRWVWETSLAALLMAVLCAVAALTAKGNAWAPLWLELSMMATLASAAFLVNMIPQNPFASAAQGGADLLPLIIAVCIFGAAATVVSGEERRTVLRFFEGVNEISMVVVGWLMRLAPAAVFVLIAARVARSGFALLDQPLVFAAVVASRWRCIPRSCCCRRCDGAGSAGRFFMVGDAVLLSRPDGVVERPLPVSMESARDHSAFRRHRELCPPGRRVDEQEWIRRVQGGDGGVHRAMGCRSRRAWRSRSF
jgi:hypothetical protein